MSFSLKALNLKPNATYRVSLVLNQGDKEINSLRSFYSKTPKFFTKKLTDFICYPLVKTGQSITPAKPGTVSGGTGVTVKLNKISWKISGSFTSSNTPTYSFTITLKKRAGKTVSFSNQKLSIGVSPSNAWVRRVLTKMVISGNYSAKKGKIYFKNVPGSELGLTLSTTGSGFNTKYNWSSDGVIPTGNGSNTPTKNFPTFTYTPGVTTIPGTPAYYKIAKYLEASVDSSLYQELVDTPEIKDIVFWLFSDRPETNGGMPQSIDDGDWKFLDFGFTEGKGNILNFTRATGQNIVSGTSYYLPTESDAKARDLDFPLSNNGRLEKIKVFDNSDSNSGLGVVVEQLAYSPTAYYVCFTIVRFTLKNGVVVNRQWLIEETGSPGKPQVSQIMSAGIA